MNKCCSVVVLLKDILCPISWKRAFEIQLGERCKLPSEVQGEALAANALWCILGKQKRNCWHHILRFFGVNLIIYFIRPRRSRSAAACSRQTFPWTICRSVGLSVGRSVGLSRALWINGGPFGIRSDGSRDEAGSEVWGSVHRKGYFWGRI